MPKKIFIISTSMDEQQTIEEMMKSNGFDGMEVTTTASFAQSREWWMQNQVDTLIVKIPSDELLQSYFFQKLKSDVPGNVPIIFICDFVSAALMHLTTHYQKVRIMKLPMIPMELYRGILDLIIEHGPKKSQIATRYITNQVITVTTDSKEGQIHAVMKNLSVGGAFFTFEKDSIGLASGDLICIHIPIQGVKEYTFDAKVIWMRKQPDGALGIGCSFVDKKEVYENLLKGFG